MFSSNLIFLSSFALAASVCHWPQKIPGLNNNQKKQIVNYHNQLRNLVASGKQTGQPPAENMKEMFWDNELEKSAQNWANRCVFEHDPELTVTSNGQNIYMSSASWKEGVTHMNISKYIYAWYDEVNKYGYHGTFNQQTGHYSQVIWSNSNKVGCGYGLSEEASMYSLYFICNYSPAGNYIGQKPYKKGKSNCAKYDLKPSKKYPSLCV